MMDHYLWQRTTPDTSGLASNHISSSPGERSNDGSTLGSAAVGYSQPVAGGVQWPPEYGYVNSSAPISERSSMPQNLYSQNWNPGSYDMYTDLGGSIPSNISPAALLAQSAQGRSVSNGGHSQPEAPTTIDPTLMMTMDPSYPQYPHYQHAAMAQAQRIPPYSGYSTSSLSAVVEFHEPTDAQASPTPSTHQPSHSTRSVANGNTSAADAGCPNVSKISNDDSAVIRDAPNSIPLLDQVKALLTWKRLDKDPQTTCQGLIDLLIPHSSNEPGTANPTPIEVDSETRMEILTRLRDHAPEDFFAYFVKNAGALVLLRDWGKNAVKKEEFEATLTGWLQVVDRLPLTVEGLIQSGLGKVIKYIVEHPPTTAVKDMASKIETGWKKLVSQQAQAKAEPGTTNSKKRKAEVSLSKPTTSTGANLATSSAGPATKKAAVATAVGTKAVRRDSGATQPAVNTTGSASTSTTSASTMKAAQSDSSFFSSKPKAKLPSFKKKPISASGAPDIKSEPGQDPKMTQPQAQPVGNDWNPFTDALKAVRKGSPAVSSLATASPGTQTDKVIPGISAKTGKPKKNVRFKEGTELEMVRWIEKAIYDDDLGGIKSLHGKSWRDLDRAEGNLLRHMVAQIDWYEPPLVFLPSDLQPFPRGEYSAEAKVQAQREATELAAIYQGTPPDTPIEPPSLTTGSSSDDPPPKTMILGQKAEEDLQIGRQEHMSTSYYLQQLGDGASSPENGIDGSAQGSSSPYGLTAQQLGLLSGGQTGTGTSQTSVTELLNKIMKGMSGQGDGGNSTLSPPAQQFLGMPSSGQPAAGTPHVVASEQSGLLSALMAAGNAFSTTSQPMPGGLAPPNGYLGASFDGYGSGQPSYGGAPTGSSAMPGIPPPIHNSMPGRDDDEDRWKRGTKAGAASLKKGRGPWGKDAPASQNTRRPLCTFFAQGRCRFGEDCTFSHDPAKLPK